MKKSEKKTLLSHMKKDDKEFRGQLKDDMELKKKLLGGSKKKSKKEKGERGEKHEKREKRGK